MTAYTYEDFKRAADEMERLMPRREPDTFGPYAPYVPYDFGRPRIGSIEIITHPDVPRYVLPEEVIPGVPWPPGFREEINTWSREFLGTTNFVPSGTAYVIGNRYAVMRPSDVVKL
jgi:hypothetical protein